MAGTTDRSAPAVRTLPAAVNPIARSGVAGRFNMPGSGTRSPIIPNANIDASGQLNPGAMNDRARDPVKNQVMLASRDAVIPILYGGPEQLAGLLYIAKVYGGSLYLAVIYGEGEFEAIGTNATDDMAGILVNDQTAPAAIAVTKHLGTASQAADSVLTSILSGTGFAETLANTAYAVYNVTAGAVAGWPRITASVKGRKVYDPRSNLLPYSNLLSSWTDVGTCGVSQNATGPYGATNYAWTLTDDSAAAHEGRTVAFTITSSTAVYAWAVKVKKTTGGTSKTARIDVGLSGGTGVNSSLLVNTDDGNYTGGTGIVRTDLGTFWLFEGTITDNASGNNALGVALYPAVAPNGSFTQAVATTGSAVFCEAQVRKTTVGTASGATTNASGYAVGATSLTLASAGTGTVLAGDRVRFGSSPYRYTVTAGDTDVSNGGTLTLASPGLLEAIPAVATAITVEPSSQGYLETPAGTGIDRVVAWSANPALCLGDLLASTTYGEGRSVDAASLASAAEYCDQMCGASGKPNEKRSLVTILLDTRQKAQEWRDVLRAYVPCWVNIVGDVAYLKVDRAGSTDHTFTSANIDSSDPPVLQRSGIQDTPTIVSIGYTDTTVVPWRLTTAEADTGATDIRRTRIDMPGIRSYSQARRAAIQRLNHYTLEDLSGETSVFEDGLKVLPGDLASFTDDIGLSAKVGRVIGVVDRGHGRWRLRWREYDPAAYSDVVETTPTTPDVSPPNPNSVPAVSGVTATADRRQESGVWVSRILVKWTPETAWPYVNAYIVQLFDPKVSATYTWSGNQVIVSSTAHGLALNDVVHLDFTSGGATADGGYSVTAVDSANQYRVAYAGSGTGGNVDVRKIREHEIVPKTVSQWLSQPVLLGVEYGVSVRISSTSGQVGAY